MASYQDLMVWQRGMDLAEEVYRLSRIMPKTEEYRLVGQLLRAVVSVPANIAEGHARKTRKDYANFIGIAKGSLAETETLLLLAVRVKLLHEQAAGTALQLTDELGRMLNVLGQRLST